MRTYTELYEACNGSSGAALSPTESTAWGIIEMLSDRKGFDWWWDDLDSEFKDEIFEGIGKILEAKRR